MALLISHNNNCVNMLVYDPTMSDEIADDISSVISSSSKDISGVMLIVSSSKVQGIVNTSTLSNELSTVELFSVLDISTLKCAHGVRISKVKVLIRKVLSALLSKCCI